jgi:hypothetical protein
MMATYEPKALAEIIVGMNYGDLMKVAESLHGMNANDNAGLRDMTNATGMASTLFDWAEAVIENDA